MLLIKRGIHLSAPHNALRDRQKASSVGSTNVRKYDT